jgi:hypothetical protein
MLPYVSYPLALVTCAFTGTPLREGVPHKGRRIARAQRATKPPTDPDCGTFQRKIRSGAPGLTIDQDSISDAALRGLIDDWLVPTIVAGLIDDAP